MLKTLREKFSSKVVKADPVSIEEKKDAEEIFDRCKKCNDDHWWLTHGLNEWRCERCDPPVSESFVTARRSLEPVVISKFIVTCCMPWCEACGGWSAIEEEWSDGHSVTRCRTCGGSLPNWPAPCVESVIASDGRDQRKEKP